MLKQQRNPGYTYDGFDDYMGASTTKPKKKKDPSEKRPMRTLQHPTI